MHSEGEREMSLHQLLYAGDCVQVCMYSMHVK